LLASSHAIEDSEPSVRYDAQPGAGVLLARVAAAAPPNAIRTAVLEACAAAAP
jgi:hypothetical protein